MKTAIRDCSDSFRDLLSRELMDDVDLSPFFDPFDPMPDAMGTMVVTLKNPEEMVDREQEGVSVWLYLIERDEETLNQPPRRIAPDRMLRRPLPLRMHYLITPLVDHTTRDHAAELEQLILGKVLQVFHDATSMSGARLVNTLSGQPLELFIRLEPLTLEEMTRIWDAIEHSYQLSVSYEVSIVPIESAEEAAIHAPVDVALPEYGVAARKEEPA